MPKVSVIIPTYNQGQYIAQTVESVLNQTYQDFETIVVIDGSTDNTKSELEQFHGRIKVIEQKNKERAEARNNGINHSSGKYLAFVDSDDVWESHKLEKQIEILDNNPDVSFVYSACNRIDSNGIKIKTARRQTAGYSGNVFENLLFRNFVVSPTPVLRKESFEKANGFQTRYIPYEDWELWLRMSLLGKFYFIPDALAYYRIHPQQSVRTVTAEKIEHVTSLLLEDSFKLKEISPEVKNRALGLANLRFCYWYLRANQTDKAREKINKAINIYPRFYMDPKWYGLRLLCTFPELKGKWVFNLEGYH